MSKHNKLHPHLQHKNVSWTNWLRVFCFLTFAVIFTSCGSTKNLVKAKSSRNAPSYTANNTKAMQHNRRKIAEYAKVLESTPYKYAGRDTKGFDCSGFTQYVYTNYGYSIGNTSEEQSAKGRVVALESVKQGDLIFFGSNRKVSHVALVSSNDGGNIMITHSTSSKGVITQSLTNSPYWMDRYMFAKNILGSDRKKITAFK